MVARILTKSRTIFQAPASSPPSMNVHDLVRRHLLPQILHAQEFDFVPFCFIPVSAVCVEKTSHLSWPFQVLFPRM